MSRGKGTQLNCFSPPVMVATFAIETILGFYTVWRYKMTTLTRLVTSILIMLGTFQLAEYFVCTGYGLHTEQWSRLGFAAITTLPPLSLHVLHVLAGKPNRRLVYTAYGTMAGFIAFFMFFRGAFTGYQCTGNYVIFQLLPHWGGLYGAYYYAWLGIGLFMGATWANELMTLGKKARRQLDTVRALIVGWLIFLVPTALANSVSPQTRQGIPSVMCGFAVLFALILALYILPRAAEQKATKAIKLDKTI